MAAAAPLVLVVEDDPAFRRLVVMWLEDDGWVVLAAEDYVTAEQLVSGTDVDVVLADKNVGAAGGAEVAADLARRHDAAVVYMSGDFTQRTASQLPKPFSPAELITAVRAALSADVEASMFLELSGAGAEP